MIFHTPKLLVVLLGRANRPCQLRKIILDTYRAFLWRNGSCFAPKLESPGFHQKNSTKLTLQTKCVVKTNASEFVVRFSLSRVASNRVSSSRVYTPRKTNNEPENDEFQDRNLLFPRGLHFQLWNVRVFRSKKHVDVSFVWKKCCSSWKNSVQAISSSSSKASRRVCWKLLAFGEKKSLWMEDRSETELELEPYMLAMLLGALSL